MQARAELAVVRRERAYARGRTTISRLRSDGPLVLRPTVAGHAESVLGWDLASCGTAWVSRAAGAAGPLGGDDLELHVDIGPGAALVLNDVSASLALPGAHGAESTFRVRISVAAGATLVWLPRPLIAGSGCNHRASSTIDLARGARLLVREELLLGRYGEEPGNLRQRLRVCLAGRALYDQELAAGPMAAGWAGPAVTGGRRAVGCLLVVDPAWERSAVARLEPHATTDSALLTLAGPGVAISAVARDAPALRRLLDGSLAELQAPRDAPSS